MTDKLKLREAVENRLAALPGILDTKLKDYFAGCVLDGPEMEMLEPYAEMTVYEFVIGQLLEDKRRGALEVLGNIKHPEGNELSFLFYLCGLECGAISILRVF